jgi:hypothetical protein
MFINRYNRVAFAPEGNESGGPDIAAMIQAEVSKAVAGLSAKNQELLDEAKRAKSEKRALEDKLKSLGSETDLEKARALMEQMQADADLRMIAEGGKTAYEEVINRRTKSVVTRVEDEKRAYERQAQEAAARAEAAQNRWRQERLATAVQAATTKAKALPEAAKYIKMEAESYFDIDDDQGVPRLKEGVAQERAIDRNGNPLTLDAFVESLRDTNPFFFGQPSGGGAGGSGSAGGRGNEPTRIDSRNTRMVSSRLEDIAAGRVILSD